LIFIGGVFLLENTGYLPPNFWVNLWRLWPVLLVLVGIELLFAHRIPWLALAALAAAVLIVSAVATNSALTRPSPTPTETQSINTNLEGATQAAVTVRYGAGQLNVGPIEQPQGDEFASMTYTGPPKLAPRPSYTPVAGGVGQLEYQTSVAPGPGAIPFFGTNTPGEARVDLSFAPNVPIASFVVQTGATEANLDLSSLRVNSLDMSIGAASASIRFPETGATTAHISGGASTLNLEIPEGVAAQIEHRGGLSTLNIDQRRFPQVADGVYRSPDYDTAQNKLDLNLETGITTIQVS
jgi:hypothetical protein